jgi:hypothetical protein
MTTIQAPEHVQTDRLDASSSAGGDARLIFERYAADPEVTRYLAWPRHASITDTDVFIGFSDGEWQRWGCGPYLAFSREKRGAAGKHRLAFESRDVASTGYVFARDALGSGLRQRVAESDDRSGADRWAFVVCTRSATSITTRRGG